MTIVTIPAVFPDGETYGGAEVRFALDTGSSRPGFTGTTHVMGHAVHRMPLDGSDLSVDLEPNTGDMEGTIYRVTTKNAGAPYKWDIQLPATGGPFLIGDSEIAAPGGAALIAWAPGPKGDTGDPGPAGVGEPGPSLDQAHHGSTASYARPATSGTVMWFGSVWPDNAEAWDIVIIGDPDVTAPPAPTPTFTVGSTSIVAAWPVVVPDVAFYEYRLDGGTPVSTGTTPGASVTSLTTGTLYTFEARATDTSGNVSAWSTAVEVAPGTAQITSDSFFGADSTTIEGRLTDCGSGGTQKTWIRVNAGDGRLGITSNTLRYKAGTGQGRYAVDAGTGDHLVQVKLSSVAAIGTHLVLRLANPATHWYLLEVGTTGVFSIGKIVSGVFSSLWVSGGSHWSPGDYVGFSVNGTTLKAFRNGVQVHSLTDASVPATYTRAGVMVTAAAAPVIDDFAVTTP